MDDKDSVKHEREELMERIAALLRRADNRKLGMIYYFILGILSK